MILFYYFDVTVLETFSQHIDKFVEVHLIECVGHLVDVDYHTRVDISVLSDDYSATIFVTFDYSFVIGPNCLDIFHILPLGDRFSIFQSSLE